MSSPVIQLLVLAGIAIFLILRLRAVLGTREGFEKPRAAPRQADQARQHRHDPDDNTDHDIVDHVPEGSAAARALSDMKAAESSFSLSEFLHGARGAYEMILTAFERGDLDSIKPFISDDIYESFEGVVKERERQGLTIQMSFIGLREITVEDAEFDPSTREGELTIRFIGELTSAVVDKGGQIIEGSTSEIKRQKDVWTFARIMGGADPNWQLVATGG